MNAATLIAHARAVRATTEANSAWRRVLALDPGNVEALAELARAAFAGGAFVEAARWLARATDAAPGNAALWRSRGVAELEAGALDAALAALDRARHLAPGDHLTDLHRGRVHERRGEGDRAMHAYFAAVLAAQHQGRWLDDASTPPHLADHVLNAMVFVAARRNALLDGVLAALIARHGDSALVRVRGALRGYLKLDAVAPPSPAQRPRFLYFPDLPSPSFHDPRRWSWVAAAEATHPAIAAEARKRLEGEDGIEAFLRFDSDDDVAGYLDGATAAPSWNAYFFWRGGRRYDAHLAACPVTAALLDALPLCRIDGHAPEVLFSILGPGTRIRAHTGVTNVRLTCHLPLLVPPGCAIRVDRETRTWRTGEVLAFDDTFEHEAWNDSAESRVILLFDIWNPDLTTVEREALTALVQGIGALRPDGDLR